MANEDLGKLWGGRFQSPSAPELVAISRSVHFDWRLARYDLLQTLVHSSSLLDTGVLSASDFDKLRVEISKLSKEIETGETSYSDNDEDVHSAIERILSERLPDIGSRIRAGRSRNDQVATDLRLYVRHANQQVCAKVLDLIAAILVVAEKYIDQPSPGFTHLQHAQPVTLGHEIAKHAHALVRDAERLIQNDNSIASSPLGAGALAGSTFNLDVEKTAKLLDFTSVAGNSLDAITDRDFAAEFLFNLTLLSIHLSRFAEEIILMTAPEFGYAKLHDSWSTGSSLMPQKKNPDIAELTRGKTGRLIGNLTSLLSMLKALPFGYNRDLQEDKEVLFSSVDQINLILPAMTGLVSTLSFQTDKLSKAAGSNHVAATDVADYLVRKGLAFREAHQVTGELVVEAESIGVDISELEFSAFQRKSGLFEPDIKDLMETQSILAARSSSMGTAPVSVRRQIQELNDKLTTIKAWVAAPLVHLP